MYQYFGCVNNEVDIDILMITYNHEKYIAQAIESILEQQTNYRYRIIIGEDCSTDRTREIVKLYYNRNPDKIALILWNSNVGAKKNIYQVAKMANAQYIASLEGDDYWTDSLKIQKQIRFLEEHKEYIGITHNTRCVDAQGRLLHRDFNFYPIREEHIYGRENALKYELVAHASCTVYRNFMKELTLEELKKMFFSKANGDILTSVFLGLKGNIYYSNSIMSDHRRVFEGDSWTAKTHEKNLLWNTYLSYIDIKKIVKVIFHEEEKFYINLDYFWRESYKKLWDKPNKENLKVFFQFSIEKVFKNNSE